jgi:hypothetical protein
MIDASLVRCRPRVTAAAPQREHSTVALEDYLSFRTLVVEHQ